MKNWYCVNSYPAQKFEARGISMILDVFFYRIFSQQKTRNSTLEKQLVKKFAVRCHKIERLNINNFSNKISL